MSITFLLGWIWLSIVIDAPLQFLRPFPGLVLLPGLILSFLAAFVVYSVYRACAYGLGRRGSPKPVDEAPTVSPVEVIHFTATPMPTYPAFALGCAQTGWVWVELKINKKGRITAYRVRGQSPGRQFEKSVALSLRNGRFPQSSERSRISHHKFTFVMGEPKAP